NARENKINKTHIREGPGINNHVARSQRKIAGADKLRRKLSSIFQRDMRGRSFRTVRFSVFLTQGNIHPAICQSPRTQRCERFEKALKVVGKSSSNSMSVTSPQRA